MRYFPTWWLLTVLALSCLGLYTCSGMMMRDLQPSSSHRGGILG